MALTFQNDTRVQSVEMLRVLAASMVMLYHFTLPRAGYDLPAWMTELSPFGAYGVQIFFVISGFVIPWMLWASGFRLREHFFGFLARRILRLDPAYLCAIALALLVLFATSLAPWRTDTTFEMPWFNILSHLAYLPPFLGEAYINTVFWTLGVEFQFYLLLALGFGGVSSQSRIVRFAVLAVLTYSSFAFEVSEFATRWGAVFAVGIVLFHARVGLESMSLSIVLICCICCAIALAFDPVMALVCFATAVIVMFVRIVPNVGLTKLGDMSYSLYLFHHIVGLNVIILGMRFLNFDGGALVTLAGAIVAACFAAWVMYRLIDMPARNLSRRVPWDWNPFRVSDNRLDSPDSENYASTD